jgi:phytoene dehydrogenase-like protein
MTAEAIIVGGGHNGLVAAAYLARAGLSVSVLEAGSRFGGAVASGRPFPGVAASLSRYSYLVSLLPTRIADDLGLDLELRSRRIASYTPVADHGLLVERQPGEATRSAFDRFGGDQAYDAWLSFEDRLRAFAEVVEPTLTRPLPAADELRRCMPAEVWTDLVERPIGEMLERTFADDTVRGVLLTDALIGTFSTADDATLRQNRCFVYHVIGRGTGEWRVPVGGMGQVAAALERAATEAGAMLVPNAEVQSVQPEPGGGATVELADGRLLSAQWVLIGCAPSRLPGLADLGAPGSGSQAPSGSQIKINLLLRRLPRLRSGLDRDTAFAGTLHLGQGYARLSETRNQAAAGVLPDPLPCEVYCHTLTDSSILAPDLAQAGYQTLTVFGLHTPAELFRADPDGMRLRAEQAALHSLQAVLAEPLDDCLARDADGKPCVETLTPLDLEAELRMPGGHIFHGDLSWPWLAEGELANTAADRWGVATGHPGLLICGSAARRGGAVSGLGGHNAAMAVLEGC